MSYLHHHRGTYLFYLRVLFLRLQRQLAKIILQHLEELLGRLGVRRSAHEGHLSLLYILPLFKFTAYNPIQNRTTLRKIMTCIIEGNFVPLFTLSYFQSSEDDLNFTALPRTTFASHIKQTYLLSIF